jgi:hypothetical protein
MKRLMLSAFILISMMGVSAYSAPKGLNIPGDLTVTGSTESVGKIFAPAGVKALGGTVEADHFIGEGSGIYNLPVVSYADLSGTSSMAADLNISGQTWGDMIYFNGTNWVRLVPGVSGNTLRSNGVGVAPSWTTGFFKSTGTTIETYNAGWNIALDSNAKLYVDTARTRYMTWNSGNNRFEFNGDVFVGGILGGVIIGTGSEIVSLDAGNITLGTLKPIRGGLGTDTSGAATGSILWFNGTNWVALSPGTVGYGLRSGGAGTPTWAVTPWTQNGNTLEESVPGSDIAIISDTRFFVDSAKTQFWRWNSSLSKFQFTDGVSADSFTGNGSALTNLNAANISSGTLGLARGGLGNDTSAATKGSILYHDGSKWHYLPPGNAGEQLWSQGTEEAPIWFSPTFGMNIDIINGVKGGPLTSLVGTVEVNFDNTTIGLSGSGSLEVLNAPTANYATLSGTASTAATVYDGAITASKLVTGSVTSGAIALNTITAANMATNSVTQGAIAAGAPSIGKHLSWDGSQLVWQSPAAGASAEPDNITIDTNINGSLEVRLGGIDASRLATGSVTNAAIADGAISEAKLGTGVVTSGAIASNTITAANLANGSVTSGAIAPNTITAANMGTNSITQAAIAAGVPGGGTYLRWSGTALEWVTPGGLTGSLEVDHVTVDLNGNGSLEVKNQGITSAKIANNTISAANLANGSVTSGAIAPNTITAANMGTNSVTQAAIASNSIDGSKLTTNINITTTGYVTADTVRATTFYGSGAGITGVAATMAAYATLSGTASQAADLIITGQVTTGEIIYFSGTRWVTLEPGTAGSTLRTGGPGVAPYWLGNFQWKSTGSTLEPVLAGYNVRIDSGSKYYMDNAATKYVMWDQANTQFVFNGQVSADSFAGNGSGFTGLNASNITSGTLGLARGGLGSDTSAAAQGSVLYHNGTNWVALPPGTGGEYLITNGAGFNPAWGYRPWLRTGTTIETRAAGDDLALDSNAKFIMDNAYSKYLTWNSATSKFVFNSDLTVEGVVSGVGSGLTNLNAGNISSGTLASVRGGLGIDASSKTQGSVLYADGTNWAVLAPGVSGYRFTAKGAGSIPSWEAPASLSVGAGRGLTSSTNPITSTGVITIDTLVVVTTSDAQILTNKTINTSVIDGTTTVNTTGIATFGATGTGLFVTNDGYYGGALAIGETPTFDATNPEHLRVDAGTSSSVNVISGYGTINNYLQLNIKNRSNGTSASSDLVATANNGDESSNYIDLGINSSTYASGTYSSGPDDAYLLGMGNKLWIGTGNPGQEIRFHTGGTTTDEVRMAIKGSGLVGIATLEPAATLEVAGNVKVGVGAVDPGANGLSVAGTLKVGGGLATTGVVTFEGSTYIKSGKNLSLGDTTSGASMLVVPFAFSGTVVAGDVVVMTTTANTVSRTTQVAAKDPNVIGFAQRVEGTTVFVAVAGRIINAVADNAITAGDAVCTSGTGSTYLGSVHGYNSFQTGKMIGIAVTSQATPGLTVSVLIQRF